MNKKLLVLFLSLLATPGIVSAAGYDLATPEYNFYANELNSRGVEQTAIVGQIGNSNTSNTQQDGRHLISVTSQNGSGNRANVEQSGSYNLALVDQVGSSNDADIKQAGYGNTGAIFQRGVGNRASISQTSYGDKTVIVQNTSLMAIRVYSR